MSLSARALLGCGAALSLAAGLVMSPAWSATARADRIKDTELSDALLGQFTPAAGDPRLIARYAKVSAEARRNFSFTPVLADNAKPNRAITVVVRKRDDAAAGSVAKTAALANPVTPAITLTPVAYNLGSSVGFNKFATAQSGKRIDISAIPVVRPLEGMGTRPSRLSSKLTAGRDDPAGATPRALGPQATGSVDLVSSYRLSRNLDVTAGVRYNQDSGNAPLTDDRRDAQAVYVGTQFRF